MRLSIGSVMLGVAVGAMAAGATVAVAAIPDSNTRVVTACYARRGGDVRVINEQGGARCRDTEKVLRWNQRGQRGPQGARGPAGPAGPAGPSGPALAYAYVEDYLGDADLPPNATASLNVPAARSTGITTSMVTRANVGVYCFELSALGTVSTVQVTAEIEYNDLNRSNKVASAKVLDNDDFGTEFGCAATSDMVVVLRELSTGDRVNGMFYLTLN